MTVLSAPTTPALSRFVPAAVVLAIVAHVVVVFLLMHQPRSDGGGGGQVLGQLSVSLGGSGAAGSSDPVKTPPDEQVPVTPPAPRVDRQKSPLVETATPVPRVDPQPKPVVEAAAPQPRVVRAKPIVQPPREVPPAPDPVERTVNANPARGDQGDGNPIGSSSSGAPVLGEGALSQTAGLGSSDGAVGDQKDAYLALIRARIEENRTYPAAARRRREEGMAVMAIVIDGRGRLARAVTVTGSGSFHLDRAARRMIEKSGPFPPPPIVPFEATIPIVFALK